MKIALGLALIPFCLGFTWQMGVFVSSASYRSNAPYWFVAGCFAYFTLHVLFKKPILAYVFGHELTHAFFTLLFGGSVKSFHASERGGRVTITKSNFVITLAPYFFPIYTFAALLLYWVAVAAGIPAAEAWLVFAAGATFSFHLILTVAFLKTDQNDIREHGAVFSYPLIYLFNILFAVFLVELLLVKETRLTEFLAGGVMKSADAVITAYKTADRMVRAW